MDNNGFSNFSWLGSFTSPVIHSGESQPEQNVEQEQQVTFSERSMSSCDPENPYLTSLYSGRPIISPRVSRSTSVTSSIITNSTIQHFPLTSDPANPYLTASDTSQPIASTEPHEDAFAELASYQPIRFEDDQPQFSGDSGGFGNFDSFEEFINTYLPKEPEAQKLITGQLAGQTTTAPVMNSPVIFSQGGG